jgi:magnesium transporter
MGNVNSWSKSFNPKPEEEEEDLFDYFYDEPGSLPGTITIEEDASPSEIDLIDYTEHKAIRLNHIIPEDCIQYLEKESVSWIDVAGLGSRETLEKLGRIFKLHPLILEDVFNVPQRPKIEDYQDQTVIITQMALLKENGEGFWLEQVSLVLGKNYLLTVQEEPERDAFDAVRDRIRYNKGVIRQRGSGYLAYALWDAIIDAYFPVLESFGDRLEDLEDEVVMSPTQKSLTKIYQIRRELLAVRRAIWPQREAINILLRDPIRNLDDESKFYLRDCYDHVVQLIDIIETYRELTSSLMDVYLSAISNKMNEIMKILTVISTIFIPLTFIVGVYGMNFDTESSPWNMPELNWYLGYPLCWGMMLAIALGLVFFFWKRGWFKNTSIIEDD